MVKTRTLIALCLLVILLSLPGPVCQARDLQRSPASGVASFADEKKIVAQIEKEKSPSPLLVWQLSRIRLQLAAGLYNKWKENRNPQDFQKALIYAESAAQLSPGWDEAWLLIGMLYSEMHATPAAMEKAADALVRAVDANPANGRAQLLLAQVLMGQGRYWSAIEQFKMLIGKSEAMRNPTVLSQLTFCYIADRRIQAGLDYVTKAPEITQGDSQAKLKWSSWKIINQAILKRARGDKDADDLLKVMFFYHDPALTVSDEYQRYAKYLLTLWGEAGQ